MTTATNLRKALVDGTFIVAPGAYDCITAALIEQAGFDAVYMSGGCTAAAIGFPDYGLTTMTELAETAGRIASTVSVPVIADADTGYGNELNVYRTVREYEARGVAAIQLEDQTFPKKCGHLDGKEIVPLESFVSKIRAAVEARRDRDTIIIARTDARSVVGFEEAVRRMNAAIEAGADVAFLEAPQTMEETAQAPQLIKGPCLLNVVRGGKSPLVDLNEAKAMGYSIAIVPALILMHVIGSSEVLLQELREKMIHPAPSVDITVHGMFQRIGSDNWDNLQNQFKALT